ncbi:MAG: hypothetical protein IJW99_02345 [Clostridia bacterium]|nr:hypothetical protein [Clostridia bacterium]
MDIKLIEHAEPCTVLEGGGFFSVQQIQHVQGMDHQLGDKYLYGNQKETQCPARGQNVHHTAGK